VPPTTPSYALRFISGKYQGGEFPLVEGREIVIGRSSELDMVLIEDMVSRKHASITVNGNEILISDAASTNGTFVNGEKIKRARLKEGDRILIGTSIIKLVTVDPANTMSEAEAKNQLEKRGQQQQHKTMTTNRAMAGSIEEIPLPDLLQLFSTSKRTGVLILRSPEGTGNIYLRKGQIYHASIEESEDLKPEKAAYRIIMWDKGTFELDSSEEKTFPNEIKDSTEGILMEGMRLLDEIKRLEPELPPRKAQLAIPRPLNPPLSALSKEQLSVFQSVLNGASSTQALFDRTSLDDDVAAQGLIDLIKKDYVIVR
jgi:pSer/pThr/pTyr-binding forkhead associated (FHA) protein